MNETQGQERGVAILGVSQTDYYSYVEHFPKEGETIFATRYVKLPGGRGTNQVYMLSRLMENAPIVFITCVGDDEEGDFLKKNLKHIDATNIYTKKGVNSTISQNIVVGEQKTSILIAGANESLSIENVENSWKDIVSKKCAVFVCGLETPLNVTLYALKKASEAGLITLFNPTPVIKDLPDEIFKYSEITCLNESEATILTGVEVKDVESGYQAAAVLLKRGSKKIVLTMGSKGVLYVDKDQKSHVPVPNVQVVDTSGAGDCFVGSLAYFMGSGIEISDAINLSCYLAGISVQFVGIQASYPSRSEIF